MGRAHVAVGYPTPIPKPHTRCIWVGYEITHLNLGTGRIYAGNTHFNHIHHLYIADEPAMATGGVLHDLELSLPASPKTYDWQEVERARTAYLHRRGEAAPFLVWWRQQHRRSSRTARKVRSSSTTPLPCSAPPRSASKVGQEEQIPAI